MPEEILQPGQTSRDGKIKNDGKLPVNLDAGQSIRVRQPQKKEGK